MITVVRAMGIALEKAGVLMQTITGDDILWFFCVITAGLVAVALMVLWTAVALDWWEIAGRYSVAVYLKDRAAELRKWYETQARLKRVKRVYSNWR